MSSLRCFVPLFVYIIFVGFSSCNDDSVSEVEPSQFREAMLGTWELTDSPADGRSRLKYWGLSRWTITDFNTATGEVVFHHGGTYTLDGITYTETINFATEGTQNLIGTTYTFEIDAQGDSFTQTGVNNSFTEEWTRLK